MRKATVLGFVFLAAVLIAASAALRFYDPAEVQSARHRIGVILPLSGPLAEYGEAARNGFILAQREHPERFGNLQFVFEDSRYDPKTTISALNHLVAGENPDLIYNWGTATGEAVAPIAEARNVPLITNSQTPAISEHRRHVLRFINPAEDFSRALLAALRERGFRRLGIVKAELAYINDLLDGIVKNLRDGETLEIIDSYETAEQDFKSTISKLKTRNYDAVGVFLITGQISQFYRQAAAQNFVTPTFGSDFFESEVEIKSSGPGIEGAIYANILVNDDFRTKYRAAFGSDTHLTYASNGYDFALLSAQLFEKIPKDKSVSDILALYRGAKDLPGTSGTFGFVETDGSDKYFAFPVGVKEVRGGSVHVLGR